MPNSCEKPYRAPLRQPCSTCPGPRLHLVCFLLHPMLGWVALIGGVVLFMLALVSEKITKSRFEHAGRLSREAGMMVQAALRNGDAVRGLGMGDIVLDRGPACSPPWLRFMPKQASAPPIGRRFEIHPHGGSGRASVRRAWPPSNSRFLRPARSHGRPPHRHGPRSCPHRANRRAMEASRLGCRGAYSRLKRLFELPPRAATCHCHGQPDPGSGRIVVWPLGGNRPTVKGASFSIQPGETIAVVALPARVTIQSHPQGAGRRMARERRQRLHRWRRLYAVDSLSWQKYLVICHKISSVLRNRGRKYRKAWRGRGRGCDRRGQARRRT